MREATMTVKLDERQVERLIAKALEQIKASLVLTWHPVTAEPSEPVEVPLYQHVAWNPEELGEFRLSTRECLPPSDEAPEVSAVADSALQALPLPAVARIVHGECGPQCTRVEPPIDPSADQAARLAWQAAVTALDTGLKVKLWDGAEPGKPGSYLVGLEGGSTGPFDFYDAWTFLSGIAKGADAIVQRQVSGG